MGSEAPSVCCCFGLDFSLTHLCSPSSILLRTRTLFRSQRLKKPLKIFSPYNIITMPFKKITTAAAISLSEDPQLRAFSPALIKRLSQALTLLVGRIGDPLAVEDGPVDRPPTKTDRHKFTLWRGTAANRHEAFIGEFAFREAADLYLLKFFGVCFAEKLGYRWVSLEDPGFAKPNPEGFALQFVGEDELGWTEDKYGCLALCFLKGDELVWLYVKAEVGDDEIPLAAGNELPIVPLVKEKKPSGFHKFSFSLRS